MLYSQWVFLRLVYRFRLPFDIRNAISLRNSDGKLLVKQLLFFFLYRFRLSIHLFHGDSLRNFDAKLHLFSFAVSLPLVVVDHEPLQLHVWQWHP